MGKFGFGHVRHSLRMAAGMASNKVSPFMQFPDLPFVNETRLADPTGGDKKMPRPVQGVQFFRNA
jgi:hypothetical protein